MTRGERRRIVQEEELGVAAGLQQLAPAALEVEPAGDPARALERPPDLPGRVVQAAPVPEHEAPAGVDELAEWGHPVAVRHQLDRTARPVPRGVERPL